MRRFAVTSGISVISVVVALALMGAGPGEGAAGGESLICESPVFTGDGKNYRPQPELLKDGKKFRLVSSELQKAMKTGRSKFVSSQISFSLEGAWSPPDNAEMLVTDEDTGQSLEYLAPLLEIVDEQSQWQDDFSFPLTIRDYGADAYLLGTLEIPKDLPLSNYGGELLLYLGLSEDCYQVEKVEWSGEAYEKDGIYFRDARAQGKRLVRNVKARYGGQVELPPVEGLQYRSVYREISGEENHEKQEETIGTEESVPGHAVAEPENQESWLQKLGRWLMEHLTVVRLGAGFLAGIFLAIFLLHLSGKQKKKK